MNVSTNEIFMNVNTNEVLWILIDFSYLSKNEIAKLGRTCKYFSERLKKTGYLNNRKLKIQKIANKWLELSKWNRIEYPPKFKTFGCYTETISGNGSGYFSLPKNRNADMPVIRMVAAIWVKTPISNFFNYNQNGYTWSLGCGNRLADRITFDCRLDKWKKLEFFNGGCLFPVDLFVEDCHVYSPSDPFADLRITWVYTNAKICDLKKYRFKWINSNKEFKWVNENRYLGKTN